MRFPGFVLLASGVLGIVNASDLNPPPQTISSSPSYAGDRRAGATATVTLGPSSDHIVDLTSGAPQPSGTSFTIVPAGDKAEDGINLILGPDLKTKLKSVLEEKCNDKRSSDCHNAVLNLLPVKQVALQRRFFGLLIGLGITGRYVLAGIVLLVAAEITYLSNHQAYHAPLSIAKQAETPTAASAYEILPSASASPTTITVQPSDTPDPTPSIGAGDGKGFLINAPEDLEQRTNDLAGQHSNGGCANPAKKRSMASLRLEKRLDPPNVQQVTCILTLTVLLVQNMVHGPIAEWVRLNRNNRDIAPAGAGAAVVLANAENQVAPLQRQVGLPRDQWQGAIRLAYWEAWNRIVHQREENGVVKITEDDIKSQYCPPPKLLQCTDDDCLGNLGKCSEISLYKGCECSNTGDPVEKCAPNFKPGCTECGGDAGGLKCKGLGDQQFLKGCQCRVISTPAQPAFKSADDLKKVQQALLNLKDLPGSASDQPAAHCDLRKRDTTSNIVAIDTEFFTSLCQAACKDFPGDPSESFDKKLTSKDAETQYQNRFTDLTVDFKWEDKPGTCGSNTCTKIFESFVHSNTKCSPDPHTMAKSGEIDMDCGKASFTIGQISASTTSTAASSPTPSTDPVSIADPNCPRPMAANPFTPSQNCDWWTQNPCDSHCPGGYGVKKPCDPSSWWCQCDGGGSDGNECAGVACGNPKLKPDGC